MQRIALIPAYEPDETLISLVQECRQAGMEVVVVDDGSSITSGRVFREVVNGARLLTHPVNRGKGAALKTGYEYIRETWGEQCVVAALDADGQHRVADAVRLCNYAELCPDTLVLGGRKFTGYVPLRSRIGNTFTRLVYRLCTGVSVRDTQTGLRVAGGALLPALLAVEGERYEYEMNVLLEFARRKIPMRELEIDTVYEKGNGSSHFNTLTDSCRIYREILKFSASSFLGFLIDYALYGLLLAATAAMPQGISLRIANVGARLISAAFNFSVNRRVVFRDRGALWKSALKYVILAAGILLVNTLILTALVQGLGVPAMAAKVMTEVVLFFFSWLLQRRVVFRGEEAYV